MREIYKVHTLSIVEFMWNGCILFLLAFVITDIFHQNFLASMCFYGMYAFLLCASILVLKEEKIYKRGPFVLVIVIIVLTIINVLIGGNSFSFEYYKKMLLYIGTIMMIYFSFDYVPANSMIKLIEFGTQIFTILFIYKAFVIPEYYGTTQWLALGFSNSNLAGMWVYLVFAILLWQRENAKKKSSKFIYSVEILAIGYICYLTGCRSALGAMIGLLLIFLLQLFAAKISKRLWRIIDHIYGALSIFIPLAFPFIYLYLYYNLNIISFLNLDQGKVFFSGRQDTWGDALKCFGDHPIVGAYYQISDGTGASQMHNIFIDVLASYGIIVLLLVLVLLFWLISTKIKVDYSSRDRILLYAFMSALICGTFEAAFFSGSSGLGIWTCLFLFLLNASKKNSMVIHISDV